MPGAELGRFPVTSDCRWLVQKKCFWEMPLGGGGGQNPTVPYSACSEDVFRTKSERKTAKSERLLSNISGKNLFSESQSFRGFGMD